jgi:peptidyl-dipeptidase A
MCQTGFSRRLIFAGLLLIPRLTVQAEYAVTEAGFESFLSDHIARVAPLEKQAAQAYWDGATQGTDTAFALREQSRLAIAKIYRESAARRYLQSLRQAHCVRSPVLKRQLDKLILTYRRYQVEAALAAEIVSLDTRIQETYSTYRGRIAGRDVTMSEIYTLMTTEGNTERRQAAWRASREVGNVIAADLLQLVRLRNRAARQAGYDDFHQLTVETSEQSVADIDAIFTDLERRTRASFLAMKAELDATLAAGYGLTEADLRPWHYHDPFFQRTPLVFELDLDRSYRGQDIEALSRRYFAGIGLPVDDILARSDLYDRAGKYPHAFSHEIGREGDVRILCNLQDSERWMETQLHELGHAVYSKYHDRSEPWLLREPAHAFATEAVAMFFGRLSRNASWMQTLLGLTDTERERIAAVSGRYLRFQQILFARWATVMYRFEKQLYADPDQDLNTLWWDLVERYQNVRRPPGPADAGWASKLHFTSAPCYYHNYLLGELLASQFEWALRERVLRQRPPAGESYAEDPRIGAYFRDNVFGPGARFPWPEMVERATGEALNPQHFVKQFLAM